MYALRCMNKSKKYWMNRLQIKPRLLEYVKILDEVRKWQDIRCPISVIAPTRDTVFSIKQ